MWTETQENNNKKLYLFTGEAIETRPEAYHRQSTPDDLEGCHYSRARRDGLCQSSQIVKRKRDGLQRAHQTRPGRTNLIISRRYRRLLFDLRFVPLFLTSNSTRRTELPSAAGHAQCFLLPEGHFFLHNSSYPDTFRPRSLCRSGRRLLAKALRWSSISWRTRRDRVRRRWN